MDYDKLKAPTQSWQIAYKPEKYWISFELPAHVSTDVIEDVIRDLNVYGDVAYRRKKMGLYEKDDHLTKKGEFICL